MTNTLLNQVNKAAEEGRVQDQTEDKGGFEREVIPEGRFASRFVGYVEIGKRAGGEWRGKPKPDTRKAYLFFQLVSKKLAREIEVDGETKTVYPVHREMVDVKQGEKANLTKLFKKMANGGSYTHIAQMLGQPFLVGVKHKLKDANDPKAGVWENIKGEDGWLVGPPVTEVPDKDGEMETRVVNVQEASVDLMLLLWDDPSPEQWDSIKGRPFEYKVGKGENAATKTWDGGFLQYVCVNDALDFAGSPLENMLAGEALPDMGTSNDKGDAEVELDDVPDLPEDEDDLGVKDLPEIE